MFAHNRILEFLSMFYFVIEFNSFMNNEGQARMKLGTYLVYLHKHLMWDVFKPSCYEIPIMCPQMGYVFDS